MKKVLFTLLIATMIFSCEKYENETSAVAVTPDTEIIDYGSSERFSDTFNINVGGIISDTLFDTLANKFAVYNDWTDDGSLPISYVEEIVDQTDCIGVLAYHAENTSGVGYLIIVGLDDQRNVMTDIMYSTVNGGTAIDTTDATTDMTAFHTNQLFVHCAFIGSNAVNAQVDFEGTERISFVNGQDPSTLEYHLMLESLDENDAPIDGQVTGLSEPPYYGGFLKGAIPSGGVSGGPGGGFAGGAIPN